MKAQRQSLARSIAQQPHHRGWMRIALGIAMLVLTIQLFSMAFHRHALTDQATDCVSCYSASIFAGGATVAAPAVAAVAIAGYCQILMLPASRYVDVAQFSLPLAHAPPALS